MAGWQRGFSPRFATGSAFRSASPVRGAGSHAPQTPLSERQTARRAHTPPDSAGHPTTPRSPRFRSPYSFDLPCVLTVQPLVTNQGRQLEGVHRASTPLKGPQLNRVVQTHHLVDRGAWH